MIGHAMSSKTNTHIRVSFHTLHCDIFHLNIISSLFSDITYHHLRYSFSNFSHHCLLSIIFVSPWVVVSHTSLYGGLSRSPPRSTYEQWFKDLISRICLVSGDSCYISTWGEFIHSAMYFHGRSFIIDQSMCKKIKKKCIVHYIVFHWAHVWMC